MNEPTTYSKVEVVGVAVRDAYPGPTFAFLTVLVGDKDYFDWACFEDGPLEIFRGTTKGTLCRIMGRLGKRKIKDSVPARYEIQLVCERIDVAQGQVSPPQRAPERPRQQQLNPYPGNQERFFQQGSKQPWQPGPPLAQQEHPQDRGSKEHPAQHDPDDQLWGEP